jgi:hypothetical protein
MKRKFLASVVLLTLIGSAMAADNIQVTPGSGPPIRSTDTSVGATGAGPYVNWYTVSNPSAAGTPPTAIVTAAGSPVAFALSIQGNASGVPVPVSGTVSVGTPAVTQSGTWTVQQGTPPWSVSISGTPTVNQGTPPWTVNPGTAASWGLGATAGAVPANAIYNGMNVGGNLVGLTGTGTSLNVNCTAGCAGSGGTSSSFGSAFPGTGTAIGLTNGINMVAWSATTNYGTAPAAIAVPAVNAFVTNAALPGRMVSGNSSPVVPSAAPTTYHVIWPNNTTGISVKGSAATLLACQMSNNSTTAAYLKIYNKPTAPLPASDVPVVTAIIPGPAAGGGGSNIVFGPGGLALSAGLGVDVTTGIADNDVAAPAASTIAINCQYE